MAGPASFRLCLVGYGLAGKVFHAPLIQAVEGLELACVISSDRAKVQADLPGMTVFATLEEALSRNNIDAVVIACPDHLHGPMALQAFAAGKDVVVDKPLAPAIAEARAIAEAATQAGRQLTIFHNRRWDADFLTLRQLLDSGELGDIVYLESHFDRYRPDIGTRWKDARAHGVWQDLGPHLVDQALTLFGMPDGITADLAVQKNGGTAIDFAHVVLRYARLRVVLNITQLAPDHSLRFVVHGTKGSWIKHGIDPQEDQSKAGLAPGQGEWGIDPVPGILTGADGDRRELANRAGDYRAFYAGLRDFYAGKGENPVPPEQALTVMAVLEAGIASARERRELALPGPQL